MFKKYLGYVKGIEDNSFCRNFTFTAITFWRHYLLIFLTLMSANFLMKNPFHQKIFLPQDFLVKKRAHNYIFIFSFLRLIYQQAILRGYKPV